jgi:hypothetical protein
MPDCIPNLAGVATKNLVETIGTGSYKASYINWARTFNLLHEHAPGWYLDVVLSPEGAAVWRAPGNGGYLMLRFCHVDGTCLAPAPQAIMDNRNGSIPFDKISARDVTDTHRRGGCMLAAMTFGLAVELWAKMPLESGYGQAPEGDATAPVSPVSGIRATTAPAAPAEAFTAEKQATMQDFLEACLEKGLSPVAADKLLEVIGSNYAGGIKTLASKTEAWVVEQNQKANPEESAQPQQEKPAKAVKKTPTQKSNPEAY